MILAVDPGIRGCGAALFDAHPAGTFRRAAYVANPRWEGTDPGACAAMARAVLDWCKTFVNLTVIEWPQIYPRSRVNPNDLPGLAGIGSAMAMVIPVRSYLPREWKGQVPKSIHHRRARDVLSEHEHETALSGMPRNKDHQLDVWDAIALGLTHLGRLPLP